MKLAFYIKTVLCMKVFYIDLNFKSSLKSRCFTLLAIEGHNLDHFVSLFIVDSKPRQEKRSGQIPNCFTYFRTKHSKSKFHLELSLVTKESRKELERSVRHT